MEVDYDAELLTESPDNVVSMAANPSLLAVIPVNGTTLPFTYQSYRVLCSAFIKTLVHLNTFLKDTTILTTFTILI